jgi:hypothetical protein
MNRPCQTRINKGNPRVKWMMEVRSSRHFNQRTPLGRVPRLGNISCGRKHARPD